MPSVTRNHGKPERGLPMRVLLVDFGNGDVEAVCRAV